MDRRQLASAAWVGVFFLALVGASFVTLDHLKTVYLANRAIASPGWLFGQLRLADAVVGVLVAGAGLGVVWTGMRRGALARLAGGEVPWLLLVALGPALVWYSHAILLPGMVATGDGGSHVARVSQLAMAIRGGDLLYWTNYFFGGGLLLQFTGPLFHWIATLVALVVGEADLGVRIAAFALRLGAAGFMLLFLRRAGLGITAASLGALVFGGSFYMSYLVSVRSTFPQIVNLTAVAAILYFLECVLVRPRIGAAWCGLCLAAIGLIGSHQPTAVMAAMLLGLYVAIRLGIAGTWRVLRVLLPAAGVIAVGSAFFLVPFALERGWTAESEQVTAIIGLSLPDPAELMNYVVWGRMGLGRVSTAYLGLPLFALVFVGAALARRGGAAAGLWVAGVVPLGLSVFLVGSYVRPTVLTYVLLCVTAAAGAEMLLRVVGRRGLVALGLFALVMLDNATGPLQAFTRRELVPIARLGEALAARAGNERVLEVMQKGTPGEVFLSVGPDSTPFHYARLQMLYGPHKLDATKAHNAMVATLSRVQADLRADGRIGALTRLILAQYNVGWAGGFGALIPGLPDGVADRIADPALGSYLRLPGATPVLSSGAFRQQARPASFDGYPYWNAAFDDEEPAALDAQEALGRLVEAMGIDLGRRQAQVILVAEVPTGADWPAPGPAPVITLSDYTVEPSQVRMVVEADRPGLLRLAHPYFPGVEVLRNGVASAVAQDVFALLVVPVAAGRTDIVVSWHPSGLRVACLWVSGLVVGGLVVGVGRRVFFF